MRIGVPREVKNHEYRVAITPAGVHELTREGHAVYVEAGAGDGSSLPDEEFVAAGAKVLKTPDDVWGTADLVLKVKEPVPEEYHRMRRGQVLFTYLHLAASRECTDALLSAGVTAIAYETVQLPDGSLPLLAPMSEVAGRMAPQVGAHHLQRDGGGRGVLMIRQYRHPVGRELWEIPAGLRDVDGESLLQTAQRELREETGYQASEWHTLIDYYGSPGYSTEELRIFLARGVELAGDSGFHREAEEKYIVTDWVPLTEATGLALAGKLHSGPAIAGVLAGYAASAQGFAGLRPATAPET